MLKKDYRLSRTRKVSYVQKSATFQGFGQIKNIFNSQNSLTLIALLLLILIAWPLLKNYTRERALSSEINQVSSEINNYQDQNQNLQKLLAYLQTDKSLEEKARVAMGMKLAGEKVVVITDNNALATTAATSSGTSNFSRWFAYFFN